MEIIKIDECTWRFEEDGVRFFLLTGSRKALLIDTGMETKGVRALAESLTDLPIELLNTHADVDHIGGNCEFDKFYMHPAEAAHYYKANQGQGEIVPVREGDVIDLGGRPLTVIELNGHTPGSIAVLDEQVRVLYGGDLIQTGNVWMFGLYRDMRTYIDGLERLERLYGDRFDTVYPSHDAFPVPASQVRVMIEGAKRVMAGEVTPEDVDVYGEIISRCDIGGAAFLVEKDFGK